MTRRRRAFLHGLRLVRLVRPAAWVFQALLLAAAAPVEPVRPADDGPHGPVAEVEAIRSPSRIAIDGRLTDEAWLLAPVTTAFLQRDPDEGRPATERTELRVAYDDGALYVALRLFDTDPSGIVRRMSRRDDHRPDADTVTVYLDPRMDHLTGASFEVTAADVQSDEYLYDDTRRDGTWDAVWESKAEVDAEGWVVEMRIPYSQLRFDPGPRQTWGINVSRVIRRKNETVWLQLVPKNERGMVSRMAHLVDLEGIAPPARFELLPYATARSEFVRPSDSGDPFNDGSRMFGGAGLDVKWGLGGSVTLDGTVNPDFGQVELDPEVINLSAFETYFEEKRPFFVEGGQVFRNYGRGGGGGGFGPGGMGGGRGGGTGAPQIFYSRRIGRSPQGSVDAGYADKPSATTILGAAKVTGKIGNGWSLGVLEAVTAREYAAVRTDGIDGRVAVEPLTNYFVGRLVREGTMGGLGVMSTAVFRQLDDPVLAERLPERALVVGLDGYRFFDRKREWLLTGQVSTSRVQGSREAVDRLQRLSSRYFQRPDMQTLRYDPAATSLDGWSGNVAFGRQAGSVRLSVSAYAASPGFEINDVGFQQRADRIGGDVEFSWETFTPDRWTRNREISFRRSWSMNFDREDQGGDWSVDGRATLLNYWGIGGSLRRGARSYDDRLTRGGPLAVEVARWSGSLRLDTDSRRSVHANTRGSYSTDDAGGWSGSGNFSVNVKASSRLSFSTGPNYSRNSVVAQYVTAVEDGTAAEMYGNRYVFGRLDQSQISLPTRLNLLISPTTSLQVYAQPLLAVGRYAEFKELARRATFDFHRYGIDRGAITFDAGEDSHIVDPDAAGGAPAFSFGNPDFNRKTLRLQAVYRWEFRPGSRLYLVWTQQRRAYSDAAYLDIGRDVSQLFDTRPDNVFAVKMTWWFSR
ncbi:MAG: DUF5916 domain-containing protein [Acidobacteriota bacterium]